MPEPRDLIPTDRFSLTWRAVAESPASFGDAVLEGLRRKPRTLPCRFFYDDAGSAIFEEICAIPDYYLTRTERSILHESAAEIVADLQDTLTLVELGSGSALKTDTLIEAILARQKTLDYVPIDIAPHALEESASRLLGLYEGLRVDAIAGEYDGIFSFLEEASPNARLILWMGSSIGNLSKPEATKFVGALAAAMAESDRLLIGIDLRKDRERLERAYEDSLGVTERFNRNLLVRINRELGGDFVPERFRFQARFQEDSGSVESNLVSECDQDVRIQALGETFSFAKGERIHTEDSHKYSFEEIDELARIAGMRCDERWVDEDELFSVNRFVPS